MRDAPDHFLYVEAMNRSAAAKREAYRVWQRMLSGRRLDLIDPSPLDVEVEDIAHGLARVARWNGQTLGDYAFSVAQHSLVVESLVAELKPSLGAADLLTALLHDAPEYVIGDMISPFKSVLGPGYKTIEARLARAIHLRFGLAPDTPPGLKKLIKRADLICAWMEATQLAGFGPSEADRFFIRPPDGLERTLEPMSPSAAQAGFLERFRQILAAHDADRDPAP